MKNSTTSSSAERTSRARSSRKWSARAIRPSGPTGLRGLPRRTSTTPTKDTGLPFGQGPSGGRVVGSRRLTLGCLLRLERRTLSSLTRLELALGLGLHVGAGVVVGQPLGLGLEDPEGTAAATGELGELGRAEHQDDDHQDDEQLWRAEAADQQGRHDMVLT